MGNFIRALFISCFRGEPVLGKRISHEMQKKDDSRIQVKMMVFQIIIGLMVNFVEKLVSFFSYLLSRYSLQMKGKFCDLLLNYRGLFIESRSKKGFQKTRTDH